VQCTWGERVEKNSVWRTWKAYADEKRRDSAFVTLSRKGGHGIRTRQHFRKANIVGADTVVIK